MDKKTTLKVVKRYISFLKKQGFIVIHAYMFGSIARGDFRDDSDIDVAIVLKNIRNGFETQVRLMKLRRAFDLRIEPHPFAEEDFISELPLVHEILSKGIRVA
jgi:predicted nucleotidyltransferase